MACVVVPFVVFVVETVWELNRAKIEAKRAAGSPASAGKAWAESGTGIPESSDIRFRRQVRVSIPALTVVFVVVYFIVAARFYSGAMQ
jgi:hypothetical protein